MFEKLRYPLQPQNIAVKTNTWRAAVTCVHQDKRNIVGLPTNCIIHQHIFLGFCEDQDKKIQQDSKYTCQILYCLSKFHWHKEWDWLSLFQDTCNLVDILDTLFLQQQNKNQIHMEPEVEIYSNN